MLRCLRYIAMAVPIMANSNMTPMMPPMMLPVVGPFSGRRLPGEIGRRKKIKPLDKIREDVTVKAVL